MSISPQNNPTKKPRSKFQDWVYKTVSCCNGCSNDCIYCFAKGDAIHQKHRLNLAQWSQAVVRQHDVVKNYPLMDDPIMFPGTHDITKDNFEVCCTVLEKLLKAGNRVLVVSKPRPELIEEICVDFEAYKTNILFRFTIGSIDDGILSFWEPNAPTYRERKEALQIAYSKGFRTSVSIEPMLDAGHIEDLVSDLSDSVSHSIWIGTMNHMWYFDVDKEKFKKEDPGWSRAEKNRAYLGEEKCRRIEIEKKKIEEGQSHDNLKKIYDQLKDKKLNGTGEPLIRWKWHIRKAVGLPQPDAPEQWPVD